MTTRIVSCLVGDPYKSSFATGILGGGTTQGREICFTGSCWSPENKWQAENDREEFRKIIEIPIPQNV